MSADHNETLKRIADAVGVAEDVVRRVVEAANTEIHGTRDGGKYWECVAHSEGQECCIDLLREAPG